MRRELLSLSLQTGARSVVIRGSNRTSRCYVSPGSAPQVVALQRAQAAGQQSFLLQRFSTQALRTRSARRGLRRPCSQQWASAETRTPIHSDRRPLRASSIPSQASRSGRQQRPCSSISSPSRGPSPLPPPRQRVRASRPRPDTPRRAPRPLRGPAHRTLASLLSRLSLSLLSASGSTHRAPTASWRAPLAIPEAPPARLPPVGRLLTERRAVFLLASFPLQERHLATCGLPRPPKPRMTPEGVGLYTLPLQDYERVERAVRRGPTACETPRSESHNWARWHNRPHLTRAPPRPRRCNGGCRRRPPSPRASTGAVSPPQRSCGCAASATGAALARPTMPGSRIGTQTPQGGGSGFPRGCGAHCCRFRWRCGARDEPPRPPPFAPRPVTQ